MGNIFGEIQERMRREISEARARALSELEQLLPVGRRVTVKGEPSRVNFSGELVADGTPGGRFKNSGVYISARDNSIIVNVTTDGGRSPAVSLKDLELLG